MKLKLSNFLKLEVLHRIDYFMDFDNAGTVDLVLAAVNEISTVLLNKVR